MAYSTWKVTVVEAGFSPDDAAACPMKVTRPRKMIPAARTSCWKATCWNMIVPGGAGYVRGTLGGGIQTGAVVEDRDGAIAVGSIAGERLTAASCPRRSTGAANISNKK